MKMLPLIGFILLAMVSAFATESLSAIKPPYRDIVQRWLNEHSGYRLANTSDCKCDEDIETIRKGDGSSWKPVPEYQPYIANGDFDGDGLKDVATMAMPESEAGEIFVLIALGAPDGQVGEVLHVAREGSNVIGRGLFVRGSSVKSNGSCSRLLFGAFASEAEDVPIQH